MSEKVLEELCHGGQMLRLRLNAPPGNILDLELLDCLTEALLRHRSQPKLKAIQLSAEGDDFSFGTDVAFHRLEEIQGLLSRFHRLLCCLFSIEVPSLAVVHGRCLGGGLDLVACCSFVFSSPTASFGQPEIQLGVFSPAASVLLPWRVGGGRALEVCVSGRTLDSDEALHMGLLNDVTADPDKAAEDFFLQRLAPRSASSLRLAERAVREGFRPTLETRLREVERLYLEELLATADGVEGIHAFLEKRPPRFST